jgi:hypothetical protein
MTGSAEQSNGKSHRRRNLLISLGVIVVVFGALLVWWNVARSGARSVTPFAKAEGVTQTGAPSRNPFTQPLALPYGTQEAKGLAATSSDQGEDFAREMLAAMFKGRKPEICGMTDIEAAEYVATGGALVQNRASAALSQVIPKLIQSESAREKVLGLYFQAYQAGEQAFEADMLNYPGCKPDADCAEKSRDVMMQARAPVVDQLVKLASASRDPDVYAAGLHACALLRAPSCAKLNHRNWAAMEPDNAAVWLMIAGEATGGNENAAVREDALRRAASAPGFNVRSLPFASVIADDSILQQPAIVQSALGTSLIGIRAAMPMKQYAGIGAHCRRTQTPGEDRLILCNATLNKIAEGDDTFTGPLFAAAIGDRLGWDKARLQALKDEGNAGLGIMVGFMDGDSMFGCDSLDKANKWIRASFAKGERTAAREYLAKSGKIANEAAEKFRKTPLPFPEIK